MLFGDVLAITLSILGFLLSMQGLWLVSQGLWPARVEAAAARCAGGGLKCFLVGLPVTLFAALIAALVARTFGTFGQISGFAIALLYLVYANVGVAGLVTHIGRRLASPADTDRPWKAGIRGGTALELAWLIPILGWVGLMPITIILGAGAATLGGFSARRKAQASPPANGAPMSDAVTPIYPGLPTALPPTLPRGFRGGPAEVIQLTELEPAIAVGAK